MKVIKFVPSIASAGVGLMFWFSVLPAATAQLIPANRLTQWTPGVYTGVPGGIPTNRTNLIDVTKAPYNADKTGLTECSSAIQAAINACPSNGVVYLPAGSYVITNTLALKSWMTVRGAGMTSTFLLPHTPAAAFVARNGSGAYYDASQQPVVVGGLTNGSTSLLLTNTSAFTVGRPLQVTQFCSTNQFDDPVLTGVQGTNGGYGWIRDQQALLVAKTATTLTIWPPLCTDYTAHPVRAVPGNGSFWGIGIENMTINFSNTTASAGIFFENVINCWLSGIRTRYAYNYAVSASTCILCEFRGCYFDEINHGGNNGAGFIFSSSSSCLIEDNIFCNAQPCLEMNANSRNVIAYNFMVNTNGIMTLDTNHGPHGDFNLFEGNIMTAVEADGYFGSESQDTFFRNWVNGQYTGGYSNQVSYEFALKRFTRDYSLVGNILGYSNSVMFSDGISCGLPNIGNGGTNGTNGPPWPDWMKNVGPGGFQELDTNVMATLIQVGNFNWYIKGIPANQSLGTNVLASSLYLTNNAPPAWWMPGLVWPPVDPMHPTTNGSAIPAAYRYFNNGAALSTNSIPLPLAPSTLSISPPIPSN